MTWQAYVSLNMAGRRSFVTTPNEGWVTRNIDEPFEDIHQAACPWHNAGFLILTTSQHETDVVITETIFSEMCVDIKENHNSNNYHLKIC